MLRAMNTPTPPIETRPSVFWDGKNGGVDKVQHRARTYANREFMELPTRLRRFDPHSTPDTADERRRRAMEDIRAAFDQEGLDPIGTESLPYRIRCAWRLTRALAEIRGGDPTDPLLEIMKPMNECVDPWKDPMPDVEFSLADTRGRKACTEQVMNLLSMSFERTDPGIAYVPPEGTRMLKVWVEILEILAMDLGIERGSALEPDLGRLGLLPLVNPDTARAAWPDWRYLVMWEASLTEQTLEKLTQGAKNSKGLYTSVRKEFLQHEHGLTVRETNTIMKLAYRLARLHADMDTEDVRAVSVLRLEATLDRARTALDLRSEISTLKQLAIVQGINRTEPQDEVGEFVDIVRKLDRKDKVLKTIDVTPVARAIETTSTGSNRDTGADK